MKKKNKHLKDKSKRFKEYKKKRSYINLKNDIKNLPREIQMMIYIMTISAANSDNFNYHKPKFYKTIQQFNLNFGDKDRIKLDNGTWIKGDTGRYDGHIYYSFKNICKKLVDYDQDNLLEITLTDQQLNTALGNYDLTSSRLYNNTNCLWFHEKCRCKECDKIKCYLTKNDVKIYQCTTYEYDKSNTMKYHSTSGLKEYKIEKKELIHKYKKVYKDLSFFCHLWGNKKFYIDRTIY